MQRPNMPDPKYGYDILIVLTEGDTQSNPFGLLSSDASVCECGALVPAPSFLDMLLSRAAILAALANCLPVQWPMEKTVISVTGPSRCILN